MTALTSNPVVFFEIGCKDLSKTANFYSDLFGWTPTGIPMASLINTNTEEGIQGQITSLGHDPHNYVLFYIQVDDINESLSKILEAGGKKVVGPVILPNNKQFAWFQDPEGNLVGLVTR
ncbi:bleomycin resistance protein [Niastella koreensis]|uniref:Glyoxalase/bleomycin resistance protein/dioxygenase n=2 Tax=Niastella koreensis TaxID=354356 RepID=G8TQ58_NIAKG|nr:VOC family protein [Niastella koreensis]AEW01059.1 Glyoxalase/bleomycin resistance protein/dioxygenase [Niastella koreensis GR20-10]OQP42662.1 bleomycin resistance protein [Niastella koreensis]